MLSLFSSVSVDTSTSTFIRHCQDKLAPGVVQVQSTKWGFPFANNTVTKHTHTQLTEGHSWGEEKRNGHWYSKWGLSISSVSPVFIYIFSGTLLELVSPPFISLSQGREWIAVLTPPPPLPSGQRGREREGGGRASEASVVACPINWNWLSLTWFWRSLVCLVGLVGWLFVSSIIVHLETMKRKQSSVWSISYLFI